MTCRDGSIGRNEKNNQTQIIKQNPFIFFFLKFAREREREGEGEREITSVGEEGKERAASS